jgi:hypothetical protein
MASIVIELDKYQSRRTAKPLSAGAVQLENVSCHDELFAEKVLKWTGNSLLGAYCVSVTASHYDWAMKKIKLHIKQAGNS